MCPWEPGTQWNWMEDIPQSVPHRKAIDNSSIPHAWVSTEATLVSSEHGVHLPHGRQSA